MSKIESSIFRVELYYLDLNGKPIVEGCHTFAEGDPNIANSRAREWAATEKAVLYRATYIRLFSDGEFVYDKPLAEFF
jgi:hypothetical protein